MPPITFIHLTEPQTWAIGAALAFMAMDIVTGFAAAVIKNDVSSAHITGLGFSGVTTVGVCVYIVIMEVASCCENICGAYPELADSPLMKIFDHESKKNSETN